MTKGERVTIRLRRSLAAIAVLAFTSTVNAQPARKPQPTVDAKTTGTVKTTADAHYLAIVNLLVAAEPADAAAKDRIVDPEKAVQLFRKSDVSGGKNFTCGSTALPTPAAIAAKTAPGVNDIGAILECATDPDKPLADRVLAVKHLIAVVGTKAAQKASRYPRAITDRTDKIRIVVVHEAIAVRAKKEVDANETPYLIRTATTAIEVKESARTSRIVTDLQTLAKVAARIVTTARLAALPIDPANTVSAPVSWISEREYVLTLTRATLAVSASLSGLAVTIAASDLDEADLKVFLQREQELKAAQTATKALEAQAKATEAAAKASTQIDCMTPLTSASPPLVRLACTLLNASNSQDVRIAAAAGLIELGQPMAIGPLATVADRTNESAALRSAAVAAIAKLKLPGTSPTGLPETPAAPAGSLKTSMSLTTGPTERWYLSADVPLSKETKITTSDAGAVTGISDPGTFYIGAGLQFGDLLIKHKNPALNLSFKVLVKASTRPLDSYGIALGLRGSYFSKFGIDFDLVSPFVAVLSTRVVPADKNQLPTTHERHTAIMGGLSMNLDAALKWVK
jgi:hypothetical protein